MTIERAFSVQEMRVVLGERQVLNQVSFKIPCGSWLSLVGANGAGKSTILKAIAGIVPLAQGIIELKSERIDLLPQRQRARHISYVAQRFNALARFTVDQFLYLALYADDAPAAKLRVGQAYELFRLSEFQQRLIDELSVGELQRVVLAAGFAQGSEVLLLDEPSSALDPHEETQMIAVLRDLKDNFQRTIVFVTHNLTSAVTFADSLLAMKNGSVSFFGSPAEFCSSGALESIYGQSFIVERLPAQTIVIPDYSKRGI